MEITWTITLSTQLVNTILQYLGSKPYAEVFQLIGAIQKEAKTQQTADNPPQGETP
jgi:hypothetical protein